MTPPRLATWWLTRLVPHSDTLRGDLCEEWTAGRSRFWYWRQVVTAIALNSMRDVRVHALLTGRALALGSSFVWFAGFLDPLIVPAIHPDITLSWRHFVSPPFATFDLIPTRPGFASRGIGYQAAVAVALHVSGVALLAATSGWLVAKLHRPLQGPMVVAYATAFSAYSLVWWCFSAYFLTSLAFRRPIEQWAGTPINAWFFFQVLLWSLLELSIFTGGILLGGSLAASRRTSGTDSGILSAATSSLTQRRDHHL